MCVIDKYERKNSTQVILIENSKINYYSDTYFGTFTLGSTLGGGGSWRVGVTLLGRPRSWDPSPNGDVDVWGSFLSIILSIIIRYRCWSVTDMRDGISNYTLYYISLTF